LKEYTDATAKFRDCERLMIPDEESIINGSPESIEKESE
jgi:hypothetical protein